jgi:hypothetical protein
LIDIHQIQVKYDALADRLLLQIRTREEVLFPIWLTRRMVMRLWPHFRIMVSRQPRAARRRRWPNQRRGTCGLMQHASAP